MPDSSMSLSGVPPTGVRPDEKATALVLTQEEWDDLAAICCVYRSAVGCSDEGDIPSKSPYVRRRVGLARRVERAAR